MKAVLFDFDFTLADSSKGIIRCMEYAFTSCGLPVPEHEEIRRTIGMSLHDAFNCLAPEADADQLRERFVDRANKIMADSTTLYESTPPLLKELNTRGYAVGIVSTKRRYHIQGALDRDGIAHLLNIVIGGEDVTQFKPHPEGIEKAISLLKCGRESVVYVGDTILDAQASASAGVRFIGVSTGTTSRAELHSFGASAVVDSLPELLSYFPPNGKES